MSVKICPAALQTSPLPLPRPFHATSLRLLRKKGSRKALARIGAAAGAALFFGLAPAIAAPIPPVGWQAKTFDASVAQISYRHHRRYNSAIPEAIIGGIISGVIGSAIGGSCYYNDCGYGYYGGYGGGYGGSFRGGRGFRGGGRFHGGGGHTGGGHAGGGGGHGRR